MTDIGVPIKVIHEAEGHINTLGACVPYDVFIRLNDGSVFPVKVAANNSVSDLKDEIYQRTYIPPSFQRLSFGGKQIYDCNSLYDYNIQQHSIVKLLLRLVGGAKYEIVCLYGPLHPHYDYASVCEVFADDTVADLKRAVAKEKCIPTGTIQLYQKGKLLGNDESLRNVKKSVIMINSGNSVRVGVRTYNDVSFDLFVADTEAVNDIKAKIRCFEGITVDQQKVSFDGVYYQRRDGVAKKVDVKDSDTVSKIVSKIGDKAASSTIVFVDKQSNGRVPLFFHHSENSPERVYYKPGILIDIAFDYLDQNDPVIASELAWAACFYSIKLLYLRIGIGNNSHQSLRWLAYEAIGTLNDKKKIATLEKLFRNGESCHRYFCGTNRCDLDCLRDLIRGVQEFVEEFPKIDSQMVLKKMDSYVGEKENGSFVVDNKAGGNSAISFKVASQTLGEFAGQFTWAIECFISSI